MKVEGSLDEARTPRDDIAIIGMAGRFPDAAGIEEFYDNVRRGRQSLNPISKDRLAANTLDANDRYRVMGYVDDIDRFDHAFFGIPHAEARTLSPTARLLLEETWHALESTGRPPSEFRGTRMDVYMTPTDADYCEFASEEQLGTLFTGNAPDFVVGRLNRHFDLRGRSLIVESSCASGLEAVLLACDALRSGGAEYALVCGASLSLCPYERPDLLKVWSADGSSRSYALDADGMASGEAIVCFVLTTVSRAESRGERVHAVIRGGAVNHNAATSSSPAAPNSVMQAQAMVEAWQRAGIGPHELGFIEGHGSATPVGDSLEVEAFKLAFGGRTARAARCALSSVKANIGHGKSTGVLASLAKAVLSVQRGVLFPAPGVREVNMALQRADAPVFVNTGLIEWNEPRRLAAVHSVGMSGVNGHIVIENHPERPQVPESAGEWFPVPVSGRTSISLVQNVVALRRWMDAQSIPFVNMAHTLSLGREQFEWRWVVPARDKDELIRRWDERLGDSAAAEEQHQVPRVIMLLSSDPTSIETLRRLSEQLLARFPVFRRSFECTRTDGASLAAVFQLALYDLFGAMGISGALAGVGAGKAVAAALKGDIAREEAIRQSAATWGEPVIDLGSRVSRMLTRELSSGPVVFIQMGCDTAVSREVRRALTASTSRVESLGEDGVQSVAEVFAGLSMDGLPLRFEPWFEGRDARAVAMPGYRFTPTRCWLRDTPRKRRTATDSRDLDPRERDAPWAEVSQLERQIGQICRQLLEREAIGPGDNLFTLGADSRLADQIVQHVNRAFGVRCRVDDLLNHPTVLQFARVVRAQCSAKSLVRAIWSDVLHVAAVSDDDNFLDLGGHSVLASEILLRVRREFGVALTFEDFFAAPTLRRFVAIVEQRLHTQRGRPELLQMTGPPPVDGCTLTPERWAATLRRREL